MNAIEVEKLKKRFKSTIAVDSISFDVKNGECFALIGPNGAGKSTTIKMLATLLYPNSGKIRILGHDLSHEKKAVKSKIGLASENLILYEKLTALENLLFFAGLYHVPTKMAKQKAEELLKLVEMWRWRDKTIESFSAGMKQRVNIIRALVHSPEIVFFDEPTISLDPQTSLIVRNLIKRINDFGTTVVLTTHLMNEVENLADRIAIMKSGKILTISTLNELKSNFDSKIKKVKLNLERDFPIEDAQKLFAVLEDVKNVKQDPGSLEIFYKSSKTLEEILHIITEKHLPVSSFNTFTPTLEEIFIKLTGYEPQERG